MRNAVCLIVALLVAQLTGSAPARGDDDDLTTTATVQPVVWEPIISTFYAEPLPKDATVDPALIFSKGRGTRDPLHEAREWSALKPLIRVRRTADGRGGWYVADERVYSGWQRLIRKADGRLVFECIGPFMRGDMTSVAGPKSSDYRVQQISRKSRDLTVRVQLDILMSASPDLAEKLIQENFQLLELVVTARKLHDRPDGFRWYGPDKNAKGTEIIHIGSEAAEDGRAFAQSGDEKGTWPLSESGAFELHVLARVLGRASSEEKPQIKIVEGAMRLAIVHQDTANIIPIETPGFRTRSMGGDPGKP